MGEYLGNAASDDPQAQCLVLCDGDGGAMAEMVGDGGGRVGGK